jgi:hypothetical protein
MITLDSFLTFLFPTAATLFFIGIYSLLLSTIFGHPSYWRSRQYKYVEIEGTKKNRFMSTDGQFQYFINHCSRLIGGYSNEQGNNCLNLWKNYSISVVYQISELTRIPQKDLFSSLIDCMVIEILSFLTPVDLLSISEVSHSLLSLTNRDIVWINLSKVYFLKEGRLGAMPLEEREGLHGKVQFFRFMKIYPYCVINGRAGLNVIINGGVYDLTEFKSRHPGGEEILYESNGNDASQIFSLALHSSYAHNLMNEFLIWPKANMISS